MFMSMRQADRADLRKAMIVEEIFHDKEIHLSGFVRLPVRVLFASLPESQLVAAKYFGKQCWALSHVNSGMRHHCLVALTLADSAEDM